MLAAKHMLHQGQDNLKQQESLRCSRLPCPLGLSSHGPAGGLGPWFQREWSEPAYPQRWLGAFRTDRHFRLTHSGQESHRRYWETL